MTQRDFRAALANWNQALKVAQPDDPIAQFLRTQLDEMRAMAAQARLGAGIGQPLGAARPSTRTAPRAPIFMPARVRAAPGKFVHNLTEAALLRCVCTQLRPGHP